MKKNAEKLTARNAAIPPPFLVLGETNAVADCGADADGICRFGFTSAACAPIGEASKVPKFKPIASLLCVAPSELLCPPDDGEWCMPG